MATIAITLSADFTSLAARLQGILYTQSVHILRSLMACDVSSLLYRNGGSSTEAWRIIALHRVRIVGPFSHSDMYLVHHFPR